MARRARTQGQRGATTAAEAHGEIYSKTSRAGDEIFFPVNPCIRLAQLAFARAP